MATSAPAIAVRQPKAAALQIDMPLAYSSITVDTPQTITVVPGQVLQEQNALSLQQALSILRLGQRRHGRPGAMPEVK